MFIPDKKTTKMPRNSQKNNLRILYITMSTKRGPVFTFSFPGGRLAPLPPASYATTYKKSRRVLGN